MLEPSPGSVRVWTLSGKLVAEAVTTAFPKESFLPDLLDLISAKLRWPIPRLALLLDGREATAEVAGELAGGGDCDIQVLCKPLLRSFSRSVLLAIREGNASQLKDLLTRGQDPNYHLPREAVPLHEAVCRKMPEAVELLLAARADTGLADEEGRTTLHLVVDEGATDLLELLSAHDVEVNKADKYGRSPLNCVASTRDRATVLQLLKARAKVDQPDGNGDTPLHKAVSRCQASVVEALLSARAHVNCSNHKDQTPLDAAIAAAGSEATQLVRMLVRAGAEKDRINRWGDTPLTAAIRSKSFHGLCALIECLADAEKADRDGATPLYTAAWHGLCDAVGVLAVGTEVDKPNDTGDTALHAAAWQGHTEAVAQLVLAGSSIGKRNLDGDTPLHIAAQRGHVKVVQYLIEQQADVSQHNLERATAMDLAAANAHVLTVQLLEACHSKGPRRDAAAHQKRKRPTRGRQSNRVPKP